MFKAINHWGIPYLKSQLLNGKRNSDETHLIFTICDHFEPLSPHASKSIEQGNQRIQRWLDEWPQIASSHEDSDGLSPKHSIFYPAEEAEKPDYFVPKLRPLVDAGIAEIEVHLHHDNDTAQNLEKTLLEFRDFLHGERLLGIDKQGHPGYAFIHGNWALCNGRPDGQCCGVNEELDVLLKTGCYADLTFPSIPSPTQPKQFCNSIYFSKTVPGVSRSYDFGKPARVGYKPGGDELLMIQGPVALNWKWRKHGIIPRIEHSDLCKTNPPTPSRAKLWMDQNIHVEGQPEWIFVKLHTHGCLEQNMPVLLGGPLANTYRFFEDYAEKNPEFHFHFASAREMVNIISAATDGKKGNPNEFRNYIYRPNV